MWGGEVLKNNSEMWLFYNFIRFLESYALFLQTEIIKKGQSGNNSALNFAYIIIMYANINIFKHLIIN